MSYCSLSSSWRPLLTLLPSAVYTSCFLSPSSSCNERRVEDAKIFQLDDIKPSKDFFYIHYPSSLSSTSSSPSSSSSSSSSLSCFSILYDVSKRSPKWVVEHLRRQPKKCHDGRRRKMEKQKEEEEGESEDKNVATGGRKHRKHINFHAERAIDVSTFRTHSSMYRHSGYDRGR
jgi:DNA/RNA endonuclease G (NUC1)